MAWNRRGAAAFLVFAAVLCLGGHRLVELGFYHDDWKFLADQHFAGPGFWSRIKAIVAGQPAILQRPLDVPLFALLYEAFGMAPLGWHLALLAVNVALSMGVREALLRFKAPPPAALLGALLFLCWPTKDSTMFWSIVILAPVALASWVFAYVLYLDFVESGDRRRLAGAIALFSISLGVYDNTVALLPLLLVTPSGASRRVFVSTGVVGAFAAFGIVAKLKLIPWLSGSGFAKPLEFSGSHALLVYKLGFMSFVSRVAAGAIGRFAQQAFVFAPAVAAGAAALPWLLLKAPENGEWPKAPRRALALAGLALFVFGLLPYAASNYVPNPFTHMNRINEVPALGVVFMLLAAVYGLKPRRALASGCALAALMMASHVGAALAWIEAYQRQLQIRALIEKNLGAWSPGKKLLLHTPWVYAADKAPIFIASWDITSAAQIWLNDPSRNADVISREMQATPEGLVKEGALMPYDSIRVLSVRRGVILPKVDYDSFKHD
ncbi:MAG: hypothetical protein HY925_10130 [Elusimicrobia bacterium]|nr:hypothetical protein [Elusimicrobiota bacterium]